VHPQHLIATPDQIEAALKKNCVGNDARDTTGESAHGAATSFG
jgi:hypothetical protein